MKAEIEIFKLIQAFEERNNISIAVTFFGDGSSQTEEFWDNDKLNSSNDYEEWREFITTTEYQLGEDGRCISPVTIKL